MWKKSRFRESIFFKILLVFILAGLANVFVLRNFYHNYVFDDQRREHRGLNWSEYGLLLARSLKTPPSRDDLLQLAQRLHMQIRFESQDVHLASSPGVPEFAKVEKHSVLRYATGSPNVRRYGDFLTIETRLDQQHPEMGRYLFVLEGESAIDSHAEFIVVLSLTLLAILLACYFAIRKILSPLKEIERGVKEVAKGNLDFSIESHGSDELARLGRSFNRMTEQVRTMIGLKEQLLLDVSHEFRSPLTRIQVAMEIPGEAARASIFRALKELEGMLAELLESNRLSDSRGQLKLEKTDLVEMLKELVSLYEDQAPGVKLACDIPTLICQVDPARMQTALRNLVENAIKYSSQEARGQNRGQSAADSSRPPVRPVGISLIRNDDCAVITVQDHGIGIPKEDLTLIFEPFYRVDRSRMKSTGGYGLGLALCRKIILAHGGQIDVRSETGLGSCFTVTLPL